MATPLPQDELVKKEVMLGTIREYEPPQDHMGVRLLAPMEEVASDDVIFGYTRGLTAGMAPARAEDAESELAGKDESVGSGTASILDWALKDHYDASDVTRYREGLILGEIAGATSLPLTTLSMTEEFARKIARDQRRRRRMLDNRLEWLIMTMLDTGELAYNDGRVLFTVNGLRPVGQQDIATPSGQLWSSATADPIGDIQEVKQDAKDTYGVDLARVVVSERALRNLYKNQAFQNAVTGASPLYTVAGWNRQKAIDFVAEQADVEFIVYDSVYRTRPLGSNTTTNNRFTRFDHAIFLPSQADLESLDDAIGFGKTLTSPHAEGNWSSGFYGWEQEKRDPWGRDVGTGVKAFPVLPHLDLTYVMKVL